MTWNVYARGLSVAWLDGGGSAPPGPSSPSGAVGWSVHTRGLGRSIVWRGMPAASAVAPVRNTDAGRNRAGRGRRRVYLGEPDRNDSEISNDSATLKATATQIASAPSPQHRPTLGATAPANQQKTIAEALPVPDARVSHPVMTADDGAVILREAIHAGKTAEAALALVNFALDDMEAMQAASVLLNS